ncbi:MAG: hypothetical protein B6I36_06090 [Desulfobacteraceae bacterium 4572_35.1]|nr:MAG: hypothetical protein B6I36_06090 [Desulfobacteraceae bacterium 4572_35.1]
MNNDKLTRFGFSFNRGGAHTARTMMLDELKEVITYLDDPNALKTDYSKAIDHENCLGKRSGKTRTLTFRHLVDLYSLDPSITLYRTLLFFWQRDPEAQPLLALLCTYARDSVFRSTAPFILNFTEGMTVKRQALEEFIDNKEADRFSKGTLKSTSQNINSTWTKSGHLTGRTEKIRACASPTAGSVSYALLLGYLTGVRGHSLFSTEYTKLLDCSFERAVELAEEASRKGWIVFKRAGDVIEVLFPKLLTEQEMEWLRE